MKSIAKENVSIIGFPMDLGADRRGVDMGPSALRIAGLQPKLEDCTLYALVSVVFWVYYAALISILGAEIAQAQSCAALGASSGPHLTRDGSRGVP